jgi:hypothetical protein
MIVSMLLRISALVTSTSTLGPWHRGFSMFLGPTTREGGSSNARTEKHGQAQRDAIIQLNEEEFFFINQSEQIFIHIFSFFINKNYQRMNLTHHKSFLIA